MATEGRVFRDWIPDGESAQPEKTHTSVRDANVANPGDSPRDYIPSEGTEKVEDRTMEEKIRLAEAAAAASVARFEQSYREAARKHLAQLNDNQAIDLMRNLSPAEREIYLQEESDGKNRSSIMDAFGGPDEEARMKAEKRGAFGAAQTQEELPGEGGRTAADLPLESHSPSDVIHRTVAKIREDRSIKAIDKSATMTDDEREAMRQSEAAGYENVHGFRDDSSVAGTVEPDYPAINAAKAEFAAMDRAAMDSEEEANKPRLGPDNDTEVIKEAVEDESQGTGFGAASPADLPGVEEVTVLDPATNVAEPTDVEEVKEDAHEAQVEATEKAAEAHKEAIDNENDAADGGSDDLEKRSEGTKEQATKAAGSKPKTAKKSSAKRSTKKDGDK